MEASRFGVGLLQFSLRGTKSLVYCGAAEEAKMRFNWII